MTAKSIGQIIYTNTKFLIDFGKEVESLLTEVSSQINDLFNDKKNSYNLKNSWAWEWDYDENGWVIIEYLGHIGILPRGKRSEKHISWLCLQVKVTGHEDEFSDLKINEPLLNICLTTSNDDLPLLSELSKDKNNELKNNFFWIKKISPQSPDEYWCYSLKLASINNNSDIKEKIIMPVESLLNGDTDSAIDHLSKIEGILRYTKVDDNYVAENG